MPSTSNSPDAANSTGETKKPAIVIHDVRKTFKIKHTNSFKESFVAALQRKELTSNFNAIDGLSLEVPEGQSIALLGRNGSGKSTTLKMLSGVMRPDQGWIRTRGRVAGLLEVGAGFNPNLTGRDNVYLNAAILGMSKEETEARFDEILEFSEIGEFIDTEVKHYSSGMYSRLGFAVAVHTELDVLLVDEILSVGDAAFREKCEVRMKELQDAGKTIFVVSHNAGQVRKLCERGIVLQQGIMVFDGLIEDAVNYNNPNVWTVKPPTVDFPLGDPLSMVHSKAPEDFGRPLHHSISFQNENGQGAFQRFERGIITHSQQLGATFGILQGKFLERYLALGGPLGPWGFIAGNPLGTGAEGNRRLQFQHGLATFSNTDGLRFQAS